MKHLNNSTIILIFQIFLAGILENFIRFKTIILKPAFFLHHILWFSIIIFSIRLLFKKIITEKDYLRFVSLFLLLPILTRILILLFPELNTKIDYFNIFSFKDFIFHLFSAGLLSDISIFLKIEIIASIVLCFLYLFRFSGLNIYRTFFYTFCAYIILMLTASLNILLYFTKTDQNIVLFMLFFIIANYDLKTNFSISDILSSLILISFFAIRNPDLLFLDFFIWFIFVFTFLRFIRKKNKTESNILFYFMLIFSMIFMILYKKDISIVLIYFFISNFFYYIIQDRFSSTKKI